MKQMMLLLFITFSLMAGVGKVTAVKGEAYLKRDGTTSVVTRGMELEQKDSVETLDRARVQILFNDETVITLGQKTHFRVEEYLFEDKKAQASFNVSRGFFKSMTGKIGKVAPDKFKVKLRTATIGIRGTHFMGRIDEAKEVIGCTGGAISVTAQGVSVDVLAGEMVSIVAGMVPPTPVPLDMKKIREISDTPEVSAIKEKIAALELEEGEITFDKEAIMAVLDDIAKVEESDTRRALEDELNDQLNEAFKAGLFEKFNKIDASASYDPGGSATAEYTPLTWGFVTFNAVTDSGNFHDDITAAIPIQTYYELQNGGVPTATDTTLIAGMMGSTDGNTIPAHWDGSGGSRQLVQLSGGVLAVADSNTFTSTPSFPADYDLNKFSAIDPDATNTMQVTIDFGSRVWYGSMQFDIENKETGEIEHYGKAFVSSGEGAVNPTGFVNDDVYLNVQGSESTLGALYDAYLFRYYGDNVEQVGGSFNLIRTDGSAIVGSIILNNTSTVELQAKKTGTDTIFDWGYWAAATSEIGETSSDTEILAADPHGAWIKPLTIAATSPEEMTTFIGSTSSATYTGGVYGTVQSPFAGTTELMKNGSVEMNFDFSAQTMGGSVDFDAGSNSWHMGISNAPVSGPSFAFDESHVSSLTVGGTDYTSASVTEGSGKFYGSGAEHIGGGFETVLSNGQVAIGAFKASK